MCCLPIIVISMIWLSDTIYNLYSNVKRAMNLVLLTANKSKTLMKWFLRNSVQIKSKAKKRKKLAQKPTIIRSDFTECWLYVDKKKCGVFPKRRFVAVRHRGNRQTKKSLIERAHLIVHRKSLVRNRYFEENKNYIPAYRNKQMLLLSRT